MKCKDKLRVIFNQWQKLHLGLDVPSNQKNLERYLRSLYFFQLLVTYYIATAYLYEDSVAFW